MTGNRHLIAVITAAVFLNTGVLYPENAGAQEAADDQGQPSAKEEKIFFSENDPIPENLRLETFDEAWRTISEEFFDPKFNGVDWDSIYREYRPLAISAEKSGEFHGVLSKMLAELKHSHLSVRAPHMLRRKSGSKKRLTIEGVDLRLSGSRVIVYSVEEKTPAWKTGLRPGYLIESIDGHPVAGEMIDGDRAGSPGKLLRNAAKLLYSDPSTPARLEVIDENDDRAVIDIPRTAPFTTRSSDLVNGTFEIRMVHPEVAYINFSAWTFTLVDRLRESLETIAGSKGLIIDLRQNPGGVDPGCNYLASLLFSEGGSLGIEIRRSGERLDWPREGRGKDAYAGKVAILTDEGSGSTSEVIAAAMQESGRAVIIGTRTYGGVLPSTQHPLPTGGVMMYPHSDFRTPGGNSLEGRGVKPDIELELNRSDLLAGEDTLIKRAIDVLIRKDPGR